MLREKASTMAITPGEAKARVSKGVPLFYQLVRGNLEEILEIGGSFSTTSGEGLDTCVEWILEYEPKIRSSKIYDDRKLKLCLELIPLPTQSKSLKRLLAKKEWEEIRRETFENGGRTCTICSSSERLSCHEVWEFNDKKSVQTLIALEPRCGMCHFVEHLGLAAVLARKRQLDFGAVVRHFCMINACDVQHFIVHRARSLEAWRKRSKKSWRIDFRDFESRVPASAKGPHRPKVFRTISLKNTNEQGKVRGLKRRKTS